MGNGQTVGQMNKIESQTQKTTSYDFMSIKYPEQVNPQKHKYQWLPRTGQGGAFEMGSDN